MYSLRPFIAILLSVALLWNESAGAAGPNTAALNPPTAPCTQGVFQKQSLSASGDFFLRTLFKFGKVAAFAILISGAQIFLPAMRGQTPAPASMPFHELPRDEPRRSNLEDAFADQRRIANDVNKGVLARSGAVEILKQSAAAMTGDKQMNFLGLEGAARILYAKYGWLLFGGSAADQRRMLELADYLGPLMAQGRLKVIILSAVGPLHAMNGAAVNFSVTMKTIPGKSAASAEPKEQKDGVIAVPIDGLIDTGVAAAHEIGHDLPDQDTPAENERMAKVYAKDPEAFSKLGIDFSQGEAHAWTQALSNTVAAWAFSPDQLFFAEDADKGPLRTFLPRVARAFIHEEGGRRFLRFYWPKAIISEGPGFVEVEIEPGHLSYRKIRNLYLKNLPLASNQRVVRMPEQVTAQRVFNRLYGKGAAHFSVPHLRLDIPTRSVRIRSQLRGGLSGLNVERRGPLTPEQVGEATRRLLVTDLDYDRIKPEIRAAWRTLVERIEPGDLKSDRYKSQFGSTLGMVMTPPSPDGMKLIEGNIDYSDAREKFMKDLLTTAGLSDLLSAAPAVAPRDESASQTAPARADPDEPSIIPSVREFLANHDISEALRYAQALLHAPEEPLPRFLVHLSQRVALTGAIVLTLLLTFPSMIVHAANPSHSPILQAATHALPGFRDIADGLIRLTFIAGIIRLWKNNALRPRNMAIAAMIFATGVLTAMATTTLLTEGLSLLFAGVLTFVLWTFSRPNQTVDSPFPDASYEAKLAFVVKMAEQGKIRKLSPALYSEVLTRVADPGFESPLPYSDPQDLTLRLLMTLKLDDPKFEQRRARSVAAGLLTATVRNQETAGWKKHSSRLIAQRSTAKAVAALYLQTQDRFLRIEYLGWLKESPYTWTLRGDANLRRKLLLAAQDAHEGPDAQIVIAKMDLRSPRIQRLWQRVWRSA